MPQYLKKEALKILEGGVESYLLALCGISMPDLRSRRVEKTRFAPVVGLLGSCVELITKACLVQAKGRRVVFQNDGDFYKYGSEIMDEFKKTVRSKDDDISYLWEEAKEDSSVIIDSILDATSKFRMLQTVRANGLHGGYGPSRYVIIIIANDIYNFIETLKLSRRLNPYLRNLPAPENPVIERTAILDDLARRVSSSSDLGEKSNLLKSIYLVLPKVPDVEPEWLKKFDKVNITPKEEDVKYLLNSLSEAHGIHLLKQRGDGEGVPFKVEPENPDSIPISIYFLKRAIKKIPEQFHADVGNANGRLEEGILDAPPEDFILDLYTLGLENTNIIIDKDFKLTAQQTWPFVVSALSTQGTPRPYWFLVKNCDEYNKLVSMIKRASDLGNAYLRKRMEEIKIGLECMNEEKRIDEDNEIVEELNECLDYFKTNRQKLPKKIENKINKREPSDEFKKSLLQYSNSPMETSLSDILEQLLESESLGKNEKYWARQISNCLYLYKERAGLLAILRTEEIKGAWTNARKAMRLNDYIKNGPKIENIDRDVV